MRMLNVNSLRQLKTATYHYSRRFPMRRWYFGLTAMLSLVLVIALGPGLWSGGGKEKGADVSAAPQNAVSKIAKVTVYPNSALVTREVAVPEGNGLVELVINPMPNQIVP